MAGSKKKYTPEQIEQKLDEYLEHCEKTGDYPLQVGFAVFCNIHRETVLNYKKHPDYEKPMTRLKNIVEAQLLQAGLKGETNSQFTKFVLQNTHGFDAEQRTQEDVTISFKGKKF